MKRKTILSVISLLLGASLLTACAGDQTVQFNAYWNYAVELTPNNETEKLEYEISFEEGSGFIDDYTVRYGKGSYTTELTTETVEGVTTYLYKTELTIPVTYCYDTETVTFTDTTSAWVKFEKASSGLRPTVSHKEISNHTPLNGNVTKIDDCYKEYNYTVDTVYDKGYSGTSTITEIAANPANNVETPDTFEFDDKYTYLDNEQLIFALRGINSTLTSSPTFYVYAPFSKAVQKVKATFSSSSTPLLGTFTADGEEVDKGSISYNEVSLEIQANNSGSPWTLYIAKTTDAQKNKYRNVILQFEVPVSYSLGTLTYKLTSAQFTS